MRPQVEGKKGHYIAVGHWNLLGGYQGVTPRNPPKSAFGWLRGPALKPFITLLPLALFDVGHYPKTEGDPTETNILQPKNFKAEVDPAQLSRVHSGPPQLQFLSWADLFSSVIH